MHFRICIEHALLIAGTAWLTLPGCGIAFDDPESSGPIFEHDDDHERLDLDAENGSPFDAPPGTLAAPAPVSAGWYSFGYEAFTRVRVTFDHLTHTPDPNRIDMEGVGAPDGQYRIVAAAAGRVRYVVDSHTENGACEDNNYVWLEHANGEWTKYSHLATRSASRDAGLTVGEWVEAGQFLGFESDVGCADGEHLHFEVGIPNDVSNPIDEDGGGHLRGQNRIPKVCGIEGNRFVAGTTYTVPVVRPGEIEYSRHGVPDTAFQADFDALSNCGYRLDWIDGFERDGVAHYNAIWHPDDGTDWIAHRRLTLADLETRIDDYVVDQGYELTHIDIYNVGSALRFAAIFKRGASVAPTTSYQGVTEETHRRSFDVLTNTGWNPIVVSATSFNGVRAYAAVFTRRPIGSSYTHSSLTENEYASTAANQEAAGRRLIYLNTYVHNGSLRYTAIWGSSAPSQVDDLYGLTASTYANMWIWHNAGNWLTGALTGSYVNGSTRYAAYWRL